MRTLPEIETILRLHGVSLYVLMKRTLRLQDPLQRSHFSTGQADLDRALRGALFMRYTRSSRSAVRVPPQRIGSSLRQKPPTSWYMQRVSHWDWVWEARSQLREDWGSAVRFCTVAGSIKYFNFPEMVGRVYQAGGAFGVGYISRQEMMWGHNAFLGEDLCQELRHWLAPERSNNYFEPDRVDHDDEYG